MNPNKIAEKVWFGYGKAGQKLGFPTDVYRYTGGGNPLVPANKIGTKRSIYAPDEKFSRPNRYGNALWRVFIDGNFTKKWDYLVGTGLGGLTYFIAEQLPDLPPLAIQCNRTVTLKRPAQQTGTGLNGYGGNTAATETALMTSFPASMLQASRSQSLVDLPGDLRDPWYTLLLPDAGIAIDTRDIVYDDQGARHVVGSIERTELGWRIVVGRAQA